MAFDLTKLTRLAHLQSLATRVKGELDTINDRIDDLVTAGGEPNVLVGVKVNGVALDIAEKMVDILIATGAENGTIAVNGVDVAVKGLAALAYKANVSEADLDAALKAVIDSKAAASDVTALTNVVNTLIGEDANKSVRTIANEELAKQLIPENAAESLNELQEIAAWIQAHPGDASAMNKAITDLTALVGTLPEGATSTNVVAYISEAITAATSELVQTVAGHTQKLDTIAEGATKVEASTVNGNVKINGVETTVYTEPTDVVHGAIAEDAEVTEMLDAVFAQA